jgi:hypothetical protein
MYFRSA